MDVPSHLDQHEVAEELPLVTESARVRSVDALDDNRASAVLDALREELEPHDHADWVDECHDDADLDWERLFALVENHEIPDEAVGRFETLKERFERPYPALLSIRIEPEETDIDFTPGQYVTVTFHDTPRPYSVSSSPNENGLELCIRRVPEGRLTSDLFQQCEPGDEVSVRGPNGDMVLDEVTRRDVVFLATGTGVAPFKSMIDYTFEEGRDECNGEKRDVWLFLGSSYRDDAPYYDHWRELADEHENFHFVPCITREHLLSDWDGESDYVQQTLLKYLDDDVSSADVPADLERFLDDERAEEIDAAIDPQNAEVYACGVSAMVQTLTETVEAIGVDDDDLQAEGFG
ncbi:ferredoxin--NADP reductase [Haloarchaeobius sp. TZWWS8]|uniref:ferredoxin--NADP reductase n=1 Tax=Haloarchaeobius sp. TZWWS8 TaxID=3446121 RepID=UPI003EC1267D